MGGARRSSPGHRLLFGPQAEARAAALGHTRRKLLRVYPDKWRQDSSNMDPTVAWGVGAQMACVNPQTCDGRPSKWRRILFEDSAPHWLRRLSARPGRASAARALSMPHRGGVSRGRRRNAWLTWPLP